MGEIKLVRLVSGEFIVARVEEFGDEKEVILNKPMVLIPQGNNIGFADFLMYAASEYVSIKASHVIFITDAQDDLTSGYIRTTSGIVVANDIIH